MVTTARNENELTYGINRIQIEVAGFDIGAVRHSIGPFLNLSPIAVANVRGVEVADSYVLLPGDRVEFFKELGRKGAGEARKVYFGSDGAATRKFCSALERHSPLGRIAAQLFRVQKASSRAKKYRGRITYRDGGKGDSYRDLSYERKDQFIEKLCKLLSKDSCGIAWGWKADPNQRSANVVLYVDLPQGQVSFHSIERHSGPDYDGEWDGMRASEQRVLEFCQALWDRSTNGGLL